MCVCVFVFGFWRVGDSGFSRFSGLELWARRRLSCNIGSG